MAESVYREIKFTDADVVQLSNDYIPSGTFNPNRIQPWLIHDHGFTVAVVFAGNERDAFDDAADAGKLDVFQVEKEDLASYGPDEDGIIRLGNASEPFDIEPLTIIPLPNPPFSFCALFNASADLQPLKETP